MARPTEAEIVQLGPWPLGINNVAREESVPDNSLREAVNVDLTSAGKVQRRAGYARVYDSAVGTRSFWSDGTTALFAEETQLKQLRGDYTAAVLASGLHPTRPVSYAELTPWLFYSDGLTSGRVDLTSLTARPWAVETPLGVNAAPASTGALIAGHYLVTVTFRTADGEESGAPQPARVNVPADGGITLSLVPPSQAMVTHCRVYISGANDDELRYHSEVPVGTSTVTLGVAFRGKMLETLFLQPMPACHHLTIYNGRLYGANGQYVFFSAAYFYGLYHPVNNFLMYGANVTMLAPISMGNFSSGMFIGAGDRTYFVSGSDPKKFEQRVAYPRGIVPGSLTYVPGGAFPPDFDLGVDLLPTWLTTNGVICVGATNGRVQPLTEGRFVTDVHERAASLFREKNGIRQLVMSGVPLAEQPLKSANTPVSVTVRNDL